ncbi:MAG: tripartite tricarboxylate transporter permease [Alphaproteobacteria bacterium]|nr:tripartite tricarboxylate transporter permease [Alphaproteobacteria bacterium]MBU1553155.1 tripartite tricarboxylate transporter permease [Alphaproteobacteria bacterium]MBU2338130.1 tripartite tricarboxylate transporter permease [Alphaproteobacteria bacterium]MBU2386683.1 tripartite tricarboxylate transporter permease [Alphaproteobacteria bacterium]
MTAFFDGLTLVMQADVLVTILISAAFGLFVGMVPGLSATMAVALLVPVAFTLSPVAALATIITCSAMAMFAGDIPAAFLRIPGTPASAAYTYDMNDLVRSGRLGDALGMSLLCSATGGILGAVILMFGAPLLADFAINFSSYEYFWLALLGLSCATLVAGDDALKGWLSLTIGLFLSVIGLDFVTGIQRYTFGVTNLQAGIGFISVMIGAFALSELFRKATGFGEKQAEASLGISGAPLPRMRTLWDQRNHIARGGVIGTLIGALPGAGADIAAWVAYAVSKRFAKEPARFGRGSVEAVAGAATANNAALSGSYVPTLVFGIPGDSITAIVVGVLILKGIQPGPLVFVNSADMVNAIYIVFLLANILLVPLGIAAIYLGRTVISIRDAILYPVILLLCLYGAYAVSNNTFELWIVLATGILVWIMQENNYPAAPLILGLVLGQVVEQNFMSSLIKADGNIINFFNRPIAGVLGVLTLLVWFYPLMAGTIRRVRGTAGPTDQT